MNALHILRRKAMSRKSSYSLSSGALALLMTVCIGCDPAPDKSAGQNSQEPDPSEQPSKSSSQASGSDELSDFSRRFSSRYEKLNEFACATGADICVDSFEDASADDIETNFFLAFEGQDLKTSQHEKYIDCFTKSLKAAKECIEACTESKDDDEDSECSKSAMNKCVDGFTDDHLDDCELEDPSPYRVFRRAMSSLDEALSESDGGGG